MNDTKLEIAIAKLNRWLGITKPIELESVDRRIILLCKGHFKDKYPSTGNWVNTLKPLFGEIYGWTAEDHYHDYLRCLFNKLLEIHLKIKWDQSGHERQLKEIFNAAFEKSWTRDQELPIERAIAALCSEISNTQVIHKGVHRFHLLP